MKLITCVETGFNGGPLHIGLPLQPIPYVDRHQETRAKGLQARRLGGIIQESRAASSESAFAEMLAVFAEFEWDILRDRVKAGIARSRMDGPATVAKKTQEMKKLAKNGLSKSAIAKQLNVGRASVSRLLPRA